MRFICYAAIYSIHTCTYQRWLYWTL